MKVSFNYRTSKNHCEIAGLEVVKSRMIYVKERWYHRLANYFYMKFRKVNNYGEA
jgi:hypothetical protein